ncbi:MAG: hypothetical protein KDC34_18820 [Saprospiraceae bacterium]|nr:hypothetical protein [Saprospiraceae bacterium]
MDATHVHLLLTHFPIVGTILGVGILAFGQFSNNQTIKQVALVKFSAMAVLTIPVFLTGEGAEETVEHLPGVSESLISQHEELAEKAIWLMGILGVLSIINVFVLFKKLAIANALTIATLVVSLATVGVFVKVGSLGGQIRHSEIRANNVQPQNGETNQGLINAGRAEDEDDD